MGGIIFYSLVDQRFHTATPPVDANAVWRAGKTAWTVDDFVPGTYRQASIGHFMGGYEGTLYAYPWAKVYAMDMFTAFHRRTAAEPGGGHALSQFANGSARHA